MDNDEETTQNTVKYHRHILQRPDVKVPESMYLAVEADQRNKDWKASSQALRFPRNIPIRRGSAMNQREDEYVIMVGASFDEVREEARKFAKIEVEKEVQRVQPRITRALETAYEALTHAAKINKRLRMRLYIMGGFCGVEAGVIVILLRWYLCHH
jgi:hypothetical protein